MKVLIIAAAIVMVAAPVCTAEAEEGGATTASTSTRFSSSPWVLNTWGGAFVEANAAAWNVLNNGTGSALDAVVVGCTKCETNRCDTTVGYGCGMVSLSQFFLVGTLRSFFFFFFFFFLWGTGGGGVEGFEHKN